MNSPLLNYISYAIETKASPDVAWEVFADWKNWRQFSDHYGTLEWVAGQPWEKGSRLRIEMLQPVHFHVEHLIIVSVPGKRVSWVDHALGMQLEQWVYFEPLNDGGTRAHMWAEFSGIAHLVAGQPVRKLLVQFTQTWFDRYAVECDRRAVQATRSA
jgi:hypothetical protein